MDERSPERTQRRHEPAFVPGLLLSERFYVEAVRPILEDSFPELRYSASLIGPGSDVLGYDTPRSTDHDWGPRLFLICSDEDHDRDGHTINQVLGQRLPPTFMGYSTHFGPPEADGVRWLTPHPGGLVAHRVEVHSPRLLATWLGLDPRNPLTAVDWLIMPQQRLLEITAGRVFHDGLDLLAPLRQKLRYFPHDLWLYLLAAQWKRLSQQEAFVGRAGEANDELGSSVIAAAIVRDVMGLAFLLERRYAPYSKWFGTAFTHLACAPRLAPHLRQALQAISWPEREAALTSAYEIVAELHNALGITKPLDPRTRQFHDRPFRVLSAERFSDVTLAAIGDAEVRAIIGRVGLIGSIDQVSDSTDVLAHQTRAVRLRCLYEGTPESAALP